MKIIDYEFLVNWIIAEMLIGLAGGIFQIHPMMTIMACNALTIITITSIPKF